MRFRWFALILMFIVLFAGCVGENKPAPENTPSGSAVPVNSEEPVKGFEFNSQMAVDIEPYLASLIEGVMQPKNMTVFPESRTSINYDTAFKYLFSYAQGNCYDPDKGGQMTDEQVKTALSLLFGSTYSFDEFVAELKPSDTFLYEDGIFNFGQGESYSPTLNYKSGDIILTPDIPAEYDYILPEGGTGSITVYFAKSNDNDIGVTITSVTINAKAE